MKELGGKYIRFSKEGLYSGATLGRLTGGYLSLKASESLMESAEIAQIWPNPELGTFGPEEAVVYGSVLTGYVLGGVITAKGVTKAQDYLDIDFEERRPLNDSLDKIEGVKEYLSEDEIEEDIGDALEYFFEDKD